MKLKPTVPYTEIMDAFRKDAPIFASIDGLHWKIWLENKEEGTVAGVYYFKNQASFDKFQAFDLESVGHAGGMFDVLSVEVFDIIEEFSKVTRAPL